MHGLDDTGESPVKSIYGGKVNAAKMNPPLLNTAPHSVSTAIATILLPSLATLALEMVSERGAFR